MNIIKLLLLTIVLTFPAHSQPFPWPRPEDWGPEERRRIIPERRYDPYDRGPEERYQRRREGISREEYERQVFCLRHPEECDR